MSSADEFASEEDQKLLRDASRVMLLQHASGRGTMFGVYAKSRWRNQQSVPTRNGSSSWNDAGTGNTRPGRSQQRRGPSERNTRGRPSLAVHNGYTYEHRSPTTMMTTGDGVSVPRDDGLWHADMDTDHLSMQGHQVGDVLTSRLLVQYKELASKYDDLVVRFGEKVARCQIRAIVSQNGFSAGCRCKHGSRPCCVSNVLSEAVGEWAVFVIC